MLNGDENALVGVIYAVQGGKFRLTKVSETTADVLNDNNEVIGYAHRIYTNGWAVFTAPYAGFVSDEQIEVIDGSI